MGKLVKCSKCGNTLATYSDETGVRRTLDFRKGVKVSVNKNALGEDLGWATCPKCRAQTRVDPAFIPGGR